MLVQLTYSSADFTGANGDATTGAATVTVMYLQNNSVKAA